MHLKSKLALLFVMVLALLPTAGSAYACGGGSHSGIAFSSNRHEGVGLRAGLLGVAANYLGETPRQLKHQLAKGKSLADVANATSGKSASGLVDTLYASLKTKLDAWVSAGKLSSAREAAILSNATTKLTTLVNKHWSHRDKHGDHH
ncbi:MAG TPA: hypothetical protein VGH52_00380 [Gaiellaceae bacterium]|jgi:uncharacterized protein YidB (DUF937 family)